MMDDEEDSLEASILKALSARSTNSVSLESQGQPVAASPIRTPVQKPPQAKPTFKPPPISIQQSPLVKPSYDPPAIPSTPPGKPLVVQSSTPIPVTPTKEQSSKENVGVPQGLVKGYGGAIEKTLAARAKEIQSAKISQAPLRPVRQLSQQAETVKEENSRDSDRQSKHSDDSSSVTGLDGQLVHSWFMALTRNDMSTAIAMAKREPKLVSLRDNMAGYTPVHWAVHHGNLELLRFLCQNFDTNKLAKTRAGYTALHLAYVRQKIDAADALIDLYGFDPEELDYSGHAPSYYMKTSMERNHQKHHSSSSLMGQKKTISKAFNNGLRRIESLNAKVRSSMMRKRAHGLAPFAVKESRSSPLFPRGNDDTAMMPPPVTIPKQRARATSDLFRRGSEISESSRANSLVSMDATSSTSIGRPEKAFDSGSDSVSMNESESVESFPKSIDSFPKSTSSLSLGGISGASGGKKASPLVYTKALSSFDDGSVV